MHEQSLVRALLSQVAQVREENGRRNVTAIHVEVGPLSGVEPELLTSAFLQLRTDSCASQAELVLQHVDLLGYCSLCKTESLIEDFNFRCPNCSEGLSVTCGDSLTLTSITLADEPSLQSAIEEESTS